MVDLSITDTIIAAILGALGWIAKQLYDMWKESRGRRKTEVQKLTAERDQYRTKKFLWKRAYYALLYIALQTGVKEQDLPRTPDDDNK